ncbi:YybH family protein [Terrimonas alba]|uniref:YybH family protein n=1 Tax=Terrimonas alba TaxID=3349636 RepID=UPI0035F4EA03
MRKKLNSLVVVITLISMTVCNDVSAQEKKVKIKTSFDLSAAKSAIEATNAKFSEAFRKGDSVAVASFYTSDGWMLPPNSEPIKGEGITGAWGSFIRMGVKDLKLMTDEILGNQDQLTEIGRYEIVDNQDKVVDSGKYIVVWKPVNGTWKLYRDMWSSNMPMTRPQ